MIQFLAILLGAQKAKADQRGASAVEYGLLVAALAALIIGAVFLFYQDLAGIFSDTSSKLGTDGKPSAPTT
ncbi:pilus assembly protein Flp/PilA [Nocardioides zeae]|uniref:Pilus assembly protein Flp/PilA n=1 Tax=Nocardioides zeae TaxID=1457234 RepID=A0ACC6IH31_9ACTN|nr:Flp family type IVb pilin [Nocardioides zeae]MDR6173070.1 pilus assembly protein Flp/PilA [Nocardioides zeae]MDR6210063.1 pilus assembly protein Flp/PilA [Nocardioides zeae]